MSKLMTLYVLFDYLENNIISLDDKIFISENAWRKGGAISDPSTMFAEVSSYISVENIIRGMVIHSEMMHALLSQKQFLDQRKYFLRK